VLLYITFYTELSKMEHIPATASRMDGTTSLLLRLLIFKCLNAMSRRSHSDKSSSSSMNTLSLMSSDLQPLNDPCFSSSKAIKITCFIKHLHLRVRFVSGTTRGGLGLRGCKAPPFIGTGIGGATRSDSVVYTANTKQHA